MDPEKDSTVIRDGDHVIIDINKERQSCVKIMSNGKLKIGKDFVSTAPLIGQTFGSLFEVAGPPARLEKRRRICETASEDWNSVTEIDRNNSSLEDKGTANQLLTTADVELLKAQGKSGDEIVAALTQGSSTFQQKTQFSQEKYKRKKSKKYTQHVTAIRPTAQSLAEFYFRKVPVKTGWLRPDSLAILLSLANISSHSRTLVVDGTGGLIAAAVLERMGFQGTVVNAYTGDRRPSTEIVSLLNFRGSLKEVHNQISLASLLELLKNGQEIQANGDKNDDQQTNGLDKGSPVKRARLEDSPMQATNGAVTKQPAETQPVPEEELDKASAPWNESLLQEGETKDKDEETENGVAESERQAHFERERREREARMQNLCCQGFQSCILGHAGAEPSALVQAVLPLLAPSAAFAVFHPTLQPLAECMNDLIASKSAIAMQLQESWFREYQVLPGRTHPTMSTSGTGGYILSGTRIIHQ